MRLNELTKGDPNTLISRLQFERYRDTAQQNRPTEGSCPIKTEGKILRSSQIASKITESQLKPKTRKRCCSQGKLLVPHMWRHPSGAACPLELLPDTNFEMYFAEKRAHIARSALQMKNWRY
jgi:hypothetical protein